MSAPAPDIEWFRAQLSFVRAHIDDAIGAAHDSAASANLARAVDICDHIAAELYKALLAPGERGKIERDLSSLRSTLQSLQAHRTGQK
jgi:hypothetical protein